MHKLFPANIFPNSFFQKHTPGPIGGIWKKVLLLYFHQGCTVQIHLRFQSPRLNPLTGEGVCLTITLTAGARLPPSLVCPPKAIWQIFTQDFSLKESLSQVYTAPTFSFLLHLLLFTQMLNIPIIPLS